MDDVDENVPLGSKLLITFPKSSEDHRLQLVGINGSMFAIVHSPLESLGPIHLHCEEWSLILLAPLKSKVDIQVSAINVICLNEIATEKGNVNIHASNRLVKFANLFSPPEKITHMSKGGEFAFGDDPGAFLYYYRIFVNVINGVRSGDPESLSQAQQQFIAVLCTLADKIAGHSEDLDLHKVLNIWNIPTLKS